MASVSTTPHPHSIPSFMLHYPSENLPPTASSRCLNYFSFFSVSFLPPASAASAGASDPGKRRPSRESCGSCGRSFFSLDHRSEDISQWRPQEDHRSSFGGGGGGAAGAAGAGSTSSANLTSVTRYTIYLRNYPSRIHVAPTLPNILLHYLLFMFCLPPFFSLSLSLSFIVIKNEIIYLKKSKKST